MSVTIQTQETETEIGAFEEQTLDEDELFHLLKSERRRRALRYLLNAETEPVEMRTLAEAVAAEEYNTTVEALHSDQRQRVYITLYQSHLPQLDRAGVIEYNQSRGRITTTPLIEEFEPYLETFPRHDDSGDESMFSSLAGFGAGGTVMFVLMNVIGAAMTLFVGVAMLVLLSFGLLFRRR